ncbi:MAG: DUF5672 family protein [Nitrosomonadales bacterium]
MWPDARSIEIPRIKTVDEYNALIISEVPKHLVTDFFIIAQYDGFILRPEAFRPEFYNFDYIGALWHNFSFFRVGNGGFSWRSRRLAELVASMADFRAKGEPEDLFIGRVLRIALETRHGCRFADETTATRFSTENILFPETSFGFHGLMNLPQVYRESLPYLINNLPERVLNQGLGQLSLGVNALDEVSKNIFWECVNRRMQNSATKKNN